ncbi:MAG: dephospho-CoA kinase [Planctomycetota bacterium]|nr:dephospho-CoA kinase [Planctomycetota bacterium]
MARALPHGTVVVRPAWRSVAARSLGVLVWCAALWALLIVARGVLPPTVLGWATGPVVRAGLGVLLIVAGLKLGQEIVIRLSRAYTLGPRTLTSTYGVFRRTRVELPLANVQQAALDKTLAERLFGLGTIVVTTAGSQTIDLAWVAVARPEERLAMINTAVERARHPERGVRVFGLAGGVGSGKSAVGAILAERGYLVVDSDKEAKAALDRPEVLGQLVRWWGKRVVRENGTADRAAIAEIVFGDAGERARLEGLVHPLVKAGRGQLVARAAAEGRPGVVVDAPLLFEAGSDAECDAVIFVEAPRDVRVKRVRETRGWDEAELDRREKAQLPLEEKRRRSDIVVVNDSGLERLRERVLAALDAWSPGSEDGESLSRV